MHVTQWRKRFVKNAAKVLKKAFISQAHAKEHYPKMKTLARLIKRR